MSDNGEYTYNKGEWSELYVAAVLMRDGTLAIADSDLDPTDQRIRILKIFMDSTEGFASYNITSDGTDIALQDEVIKHVKINRQDIEELLAGIKQGSQGASRTFEIPAGNRLMDTLLLKGFKAGAKNKDDVNTISILPAEVTERQVDYSVKSQLGSPATLVNASGVTTFTYRVDGFRGDLHQINSITTHSKIMDRIAAVQSYGGVFSFSDVPNQNFRANLRMVDTSFPEMMAAILFAYFTHSGSSSIKELCRLAAIELRDKFTEAEITSNVLRFLEYMSFGMIPGTIWDKKRSVDGFIFVKKDGQLVCYTLYELTQFKEYLLENTRLDTGSSGRNDFGTLYRDQSGGLFFDLNLDIRMKH